MKTILFGVLLVVGYVYMGATMVSDIIDEAQGAGPQQTLAATR